MRKYLYILMSALILTAPNISIGKGQPWYSYAGVLPITKDSKQQMWVYMGVEYVNNEKRLAILAGQKDKNDKDSPNTALRELNEESLDVFNEYINISTFTKDVPQINNNVWLLFSTALYLFVINDKSAEANCDKFIQLYNERRYHGVDKYKKLKLAQRESYELRKVKLNDLIEFLNGPHKAGTALVSYGGKNCDVTSIPLRWSSKILLKNQAKLQDLVK